MAFGSSVTLTANVAALWPATGTPNGTVEFYYGTIDLGSGSWNATTLTATLTTPILTEGSHNFTAVYTDYGTFDPSTSAPVSVLVSYPTLSGTSLTLTGPQRPTRATRSTCRTTTRTITIIPSPSAR